MIFNKKIITLPGSTYYSRLIIIHDKNEWLVIDLGGRSSKLHLIAGLFNNHPVYSLERGLEANGWRIKYGQKLNFAITHNHPDHCSGIPKWLENSHSEVYCHPKSVDNLIASSPWWYLIERNEKLLGKDLAKFKEWPNWLIVFAATLIYNKWKPISENRIKVLSSGQILKVGKIRLEVIFLPGHTEDSVVYWFEKQGILISGDLIRTYDGDPLPCLNTSQVNFVDTLESIEKLTKLPIKVLIPGHGPIVQGMKKINNLIQAHLEMSSKAKDQASYFLSRKPNASIQELIHFIEKDWPLTRKSDKKYLVWALIQAYKPKA